MPLLEVPANDIDAAGLGIDAELPPAWLAEELAEANLTSVGPGHVTARLSRSGKDGIVVRGRVKAELVTPCARCLDPARVPVDTELTLLLHPAAAPPGANGKARAPARESDAEYEFTADEADVDHYDGETVVLDPFVREAILLEVPNFPLCSEDCAGIQPAAPAPAQAGARTEIDPRLAPLAALRDKLQRASREAPSKKKKKE